MDSLRILVTNDDGIQAPGLAILEAVARDLSSDVWVVAPEVEQSGAGHSLTLRRPLRIHEVAPRRFMVDGTPTDCVLMAVHRIIDGKRPDLVLSGVNRGGNLAEDVTYSGTVAAAMEATLLGIKAIALSQNREETGPKERVAEEEIFPWETARAHGPELIRRLWKAAWPQDILYNVNFPACSPDEVRGVRAARQGRRIGAIQVVEGRDPKGRSYYWIGDFSNTQPAGDETDLEAVAGNRIAVSPLHLDLTHGLGLEGLQSLFEAPI